MRFLTAEKIITNCSQPLRDSVIVTDDLGTILETKTEKEIDPLKIERFHGIICPGFVNAHCHLELSFMKRKIVPGVGLHHFIKEVEKLKKPADEEIQQAIKDADELMFNNGIVAVGDICNTASTFSFKTRSKIIYHNFIEVYAFDETRAEQAFARGLKVLEELKKQNPKGAKQYSITPHAPYSASAKLLKLISDHALEHHSILTIHNQETADEDLFFREKKGNIPERLKYFGIDTDKWKAPGCSSLQWFLPLLSSSLKLQLVHNTFTGKDDIAFAQAHHKNLYWCFCPNANLYIENKLPAVDLFLQNSEFITIGTDSYASNWNLSVLDEMRILKKHFPELSFEQMISWASLNGAKYLGLDHTFGSIEKGKRPGLNVVSNDLVEVKKII